MVDSPFFSIIIPTYNRADILADCIKQIQKQTFGEFEILIVDDGSTDKTQEIVAKIKDTRLKYLRTENRERSHARNYGLKYSIGNYINYFDSDDVMYPERLSEVYKFIHQNGSPPVLFTGYDFIDEQSRKVGQMNRHYKSFTTDLLFNNFLAVNSVFMKSNVARSFPFLEDRRLITAEDWELWLRIHTQYDFMEMPVNTFAICQHASRSLATISFSRIKERDNFFAELVAQNDHLKLKYGEKAIKLFCADRYTYIALVASLQKDMKTARHFLLRSLNTSTYVLLRKRFWAVLKKLA